MSAQWPLLIVVLLSGAGGWLLAAACGHMLAGGAGSSVQARTSHEIACILVALAMIVAIAVEGISLGDASALIHTLSRPGSAAFFLAASLVVSLVLAVVVILASRREAGAGIMRAICVLAVVAGVAVAVSGAAEMLPSSFSAWNTPLVPVALCATEAAVGVPLFCALEGLDDEARTGAAQALVGVLAIVAGGVATVSVAAYVAKTGLVGLSDSGNTALWGIGAVVCAALSCAFAIAAWVARKKRVVCAVLALLAAVCGVLCCVALRLYMGDFAVRRFNLMNSPLGRLSGR